MRSGDAPRRGWGRHLTHGPRTVAGRAFASPYAAWVLRLLFESGASMPRMGTSGRSGWWWRRRRRSPSRAAAAAAVAATGGGSRGSDFLDSVAKHLGVSPQKLKDATKAAAVDQVNADLAAGRITKAQADEMKERIEAGDGVLGGPGGPGFGRGPGRPGGFGVGPGFGKPFHRQRAGRRGQVPRPQRERPAHQARDGQSLADVAKAQSKDLAGLSRRSSTPPRPTSTRPWPTRSSRRARPTTSSPA